jgi:enoyl-CoA hydratase
LPVDYTRQGPVGLVTLNRPDQLNSLSHEMLAGIHHALDLVDADPDVRAVIITGAGDKAFSAGADISAMKEASALEAREFAALGHAVGARIEAFPRPVIAAINGYALGGGCELALACDIRLVSDRARLGQPEVNIGVLPGWGGTQRLVRVAGLGFAKELIFTGRMCGAEEALARGLANRVVPHESLMDEATTLAELIASKAPWAVTQAKLMTNLALDGGQQANLERERDLFALAFTTADQREGMTAFFDKRPPSFDGR